MPKKTVFMDEESRWTAVVQRDREAEGFFFYAVETTGVFCRPGCSSRLPRRENVRFFDTSEDAERAGYRPCKRCRPGSALPQEQLTEAVIRACRRLEQPGTPPTLQYLAEEAGLSPWHFHRVFKKIVGITPKQYAATRQAQNFRKNLNARETVTEAIYNSGFSSSSRAYETIDSRLGMTPSHYKAGAPGLTVVYGTARCYLGWVIVAATVRGICAIEFGDDPGTLPAQVQERFPGADIVEAGPGFSSVIQKVIAFIDAPEKGLELPLDIQGTAFQERVWSALRDILPGRTASYTEIAKRIGRPEAVRAVARACAANKIAVAIPCHRVVRSDGKLSGYRWGIERKRTLLDHESSGGEPAENRDEESA